MILKFKRPVQRRPTHFTKELKLKSYESAESRIKENEEVLGCRPYRRHRYVTS